MEQDYLIAGLHIRMDSFGRTVEQAKPYLTQCVEKPDIVITSNPDALHQRQPHLSLEACEYMCTGSSFYTQLLQFDGMLVHASAVVMDGYAYLFSAPSGTGKSTHTKLWQQAFGKDRVQILNDDKPALRRENGRWYAYGTPWSGKTDLNLNLQVPLGGVCILSRADVNEIESFGGADAVFALLEQTVRPQAAGARAKLLQLLDSLLTEVPVWKLHCTPEEEAARVAHDAMAEEAGKRFG